MIDKLKDAELQENNNNNNNKSLIFMNLPLDKISNVSLLTGCLSVLSVVCLF